LALLVMGGVVAWFAVRDRGAASSMRATRMAIDEVARLTIEIIEQGRVITEQARVIRQLNRQLMEAGLTPRAKPNGIIKAVEKGERPLLALHELIGTHFNLDEMTSLAFEMGIEPEEIGGETRAQRALSLIDYCTRHDLLQELVAACIRLRPTVEWPKIP
jgi:hypothetical protein